MSRATSLPDDSEDASFCPSHPLCTRARAHTHTPPPSQGSPQQWLRHSHGRLCSEWAEADPHGGGVGGLVSVVRGARALWSYRLW